MGSDRCRVLVGAVALVSTVQYLVVEQVVARTWSDPDYSWTRNYVSDLGVVDCGPVVCSPGHVTMNVSLLVHAGLLVLGVATLSGLLGPRWLRLMVSLLFGVNAIGNVIVAVFPRQPQAHGADDLHYLGAGMATVGGLVGVGLVGAAALRMPRRRSFGLFSLACAGAALGGLGLLQTTGDALPQGMLERIAIDPVIVWYAGTGTLLAYLAMRRDRSVSARQDLSASSP